MKILVTGGAGFIGSHTVKLLERFKNEVQVIDNFYTGSQQNLKNAVCKIHREDITDEREVRIVVRDFEPDVILHLAAQSAISTSLRDPQMDMSVNAIGTLNLLKAARDYSVKRFVFASTSAVYSEKSYLLTKFIGLGEWTPCEPSTPYGISKLAAEQYIRTMFPNHMILRYANVYGPRQVAIGENQVIARAFAHFMDGNIFKITGHGNQKRDFVYVGDVANCNLDAILSKRVGTFNVASGKSHSVNEVLKELEKVYGVPGYKWERTLRTDPRGDVYLNANAIRAEIGWRAKVPLSEGIRRTYDWWENGKGSVHEIMGEA